jgi:hypothetical protein
MANKKIVLVFVHGWSVDNTDTYGGLPERLRAVAGTVGMDVVLKEIFLGRYVSFHDEVRLPDISRAFAAAVEDQLAGLLKDDTRFVCITHSTGGPVIRDWWHRYYLNLPGSGVCPMSHLLMLAPANYGSALAQLGKGRLSRMKSWFGGVEPGQGVLDWLELGSAESWDLNMAWIGSDGTQIGAKGVFPFVLTGQSIDRALYDNLNTYTGESGSDGVVRVAAANLSGRYVSLVQQKPKKKPRKKNRGKIEWIAPTLDIESVVEAPQTALRVIGGKSHSGKDMGIMRSVKKGLNDKKSRETVDAILACIKVSSKTQYNQLANRFASEMAAVQTQEQLEIDRHFFSSDTCIFHDKCSMVVFRVRDQEGHPVKNYDLILTAGSNSDPNFLPRGFFVDKQRNRVNPETITYFFNHDIMKGSEEVQNEDGEVVREAIPGAKMLGFRLIPRPDQGFMHYLPCEISATQELLEYALQPNTTTLIDICLHRVVYKNVMRLDKGTKQGSFKRVKPGDEIVE